MAQLRSLKLFIPHYSKQLEISKIIEKAFDFVNDSKISYRQAEELLLKELGLQDFEIDDDLSYIVNFSDVKNANRMDADYFQPKYEKLESKIKGYGAELLVSVVDNVLARFNPKPEESYKYIDLGNINSSTGKVDGFEEVLGKEAPSRAKRILQSGDVIVSSVEGSLEKVAIVSQDQENYLASSGFFQFRSEKILPEALLILAKSIVLQWQMKKNCAGTILTAVPSESLNTMLIPVLPKNTQEKIADLVKKSHEARKKSKELLEEAKKKVEEMIEKQAS